MDQYDVIIIGGGPAGMMAAFSVKKHHPDVSVAIIDRTFEIGRKFLTAGAGRGNLTNINLEHGPDDHYFGDQEFIRTIFKQFGYKDIMKFFADLGVPTYLELKTGKGKIFPVIDHAKTIRDMMVELLKEAGISIICNTTVNSLIQEGEKWLVTTSTGTFLSRSVIISAGGKTYPALGSDGSGYTIASSLGHTIIEPVVSAVPVVSKNILSHFLQGEKMDMKATSIIDGKEISSATGDVMFTQYGFSGPAIFDISRDFSVVLNRGEHPKCEVLLQFFPDKDEHDLSWELDRRMKNRESTLVECVLWGLFTQKVAMGLCAAAKLPKGILVKDMTMDMWQSLLQIMAGYRVEIQGTRGWNEGEFTAGGIETSQIDPRTMQSKLTPGLFFAGEIINVDGQVGGYNLSWAWATGWIAGKNIL